MVEWMKGWDINSFAQWLHIRGMFGSNTNADTRNTRLHHTLGVVRRMGKEMVNLLCPTDSNALNSAAERHVMLWPGYIYLSNPSNSDYLFNIGYPEIVDITDITSGAEWTGRPGGYNMYIDTPYFDQYMPDTDFYILNVFHRDVRKSLYLMGLSASKSESKSSEQIVNDNDNENDGDGSDE